MAAILGWCTAGVSILFFLTMWFALCYKELSERRKSLEIINEEVKMHRRLYMQERGGKNDSAALNILESKLLAYREMEKNYNALLKKPMYRIPAYIMGFHTKKNEHEV